MRNGRFHYWIWFGLILTSLPLLFTYWKLRGICPQNEIPSVTFSSVIAKGELLLVCLSLLGTNLGDLLKEQCSNKLVGISLIAATVFLCLFAIYSFGEINTNPNFNKSFAYDTSITIFICSSVICLVSVFIPRNY